MPSEPPVMMATLPSFLSWGSQRRVARVFGQWRGLHGHPGVQGQRLQDRLHLGRVPGPPQAQRAPGAREGPEPEHLPLPGQFLDALRLARLGVLDGRAGRALGHADGEGDQEFGRPVGPFRGGQRRVVRVRRERRDLIGAPHAQRHRGQDLLELALVGGGEQPERAPFTWLQWGTPQAQQVSLRRELTRVGGLAGADVVDGLSRSSVRDVGGHGDEIFHGERSWATHGVLLAEGDVGDVDGDRDRVPDRGGAAGYQLRRKSSSAVLTWPRWVQEMACGPPSTTTSCMSLSGQTGKVTPVSSSEAVHRRRWMAVSWDRPLEWASLG